MLWDSQLLQSPKMFAFDLHRQSMCIYVDPAYSLRIHLQAPFRNRVNSSNAGIQFSNSLVEWLLRDIINYFKFLNFKKI